VTDDPAFVFHSLRHTFIGAMRRKGTRLDFMKALVGHARELELELEDAKDDTEEYGDAVPIAILNDVVRQVEYPRIKFERIEAFLR
jgi:integrase